MRAMATKRSMPRLLKLPKMHLGELFVDLERDADAYLSNLDAAGAHLPWYA